MPSFLRRQSNPIPGQDRNSITLRGRLPDRAGGDEEFALLDTIRVVKPQQSRRGAALGGSRLDAAPDELEMINPTVSCGRNSGSMAPVCSSIEVRSLPFRELHSVHAKARFSAAVVPHAFRR